MFAVCDHTVFNQQIAHLVFGEQRGHGGVEPADTVLLHVQVQTHHLTFAVAILVRVKVPFCQV